MNSTSSESLEEDQSTYTSLVFDDDQLLRLSEDEPASYSLAVSSNVSVLINFIKLLYLAFVLMRVPRFLRQTPTGVCPEIARRFY